MVGVGFWSISHAEHTITLQRHASLHTDTPPASAMALQLLDGEASV